VIEFVDANEIHVRYERDEAQKLVSFEGDLKIYKLTKFMKTNQETCINLRPAVKKGQRVKNGDFLTEGYATKDGELALGRNLKVAFMPWKGYNFEDAIVISEKVAREDLFTSIHISEYELEVRDTKLGEEELTPDIPNVSEDATRDLDQNGIIRIGAQVKEGDIIIGKITPKGESDPTPEEKLLRAIFGDKAGDAKDASLKAPSGTEGVVIDKKLFQRAKKDKNAKVTFKMPETLIIPNNIRIVHLPPRTPELNPIEIIWREIRKRGFKNIIFNKLTAVVEKFFEITQNMAKTDIISITRWNWIDDILCGVF
jgi:DNA-directed RNA polymerase subunit beta